jgi:hypothetical protein
MASQLSPDESAAVHKALRSYLSELRMETANTDNAQYRRELRAERAALESALAKLDAAASGSPAASDEVITVTLVWGSVDE